MELLYPFCNTIWEEERVPTEWKRSRYQQSGRRVTSSSWTGRPCGSYYEHYGTPEKITMNIIRNSYEGMTCRVVHERQLTDALKVRVGVRQGCLLSLVMFLLTMDWVMKTSRAQGRKGIRWTVWKQLDDRDYADDLALLLHTRHEMQEKTSTVADTSARLGLKIHRGKSEVL